MILKNLTRLVVISFLLLLTSGIVYAAVPISDGFDYPVGIPDGLGYYVVAGFGDTSYKGIPHLGEDWNGLNDLGAPVYAISNGYVRYAQDTGIDEWKGVIIIDHKSKPGTKFKIQNGADSETMSSMYAHLDVTRINEWVRTGDYVRRGQQIGVIGPTPVGSTGPHLHFEIRNDTSIGLGPGYSWNTIGWVNPSTFTESNRPQLTPLIEDWNAGGIDATGTFNPKTSTFSLYTENIQMGLPGDISIVGDWDGDGRDSIGVYRPNTAEFFLDNNNDGITDHSLLYGAIGDDPIIGDWNGDGHDEIGVFRSSDSNGQTTFFLKSNNDETSNDATVIHFGNPTDIPIVGDWNNDGKDDIGVFRRNDPANSNNAVFYLMNGAETITIVFGNNDDTPIVGKPNNDGLTRIGVYRPSAQSPFIFKPEPVTASGNPLLSVSVLENPDPVNSGQNSQVTVHVTSEGAPATGANIEVSTTGGTLGQTIGATNANGDS